jgi:hypothetical protein
MRAENLSLIGRDANLPMAMANYPRQISNSVRRH